MSYFVELTKPRAVTGGAAKPSPPSRQFCRNSGVRESNFGKFDRKKSHDIGQLQTNFLLGTSFAFSEGKYPKEVESMRTKKNRLIVVGAVVAIVLGGSWAFAHGPRGVRGHGYSGCEHGYPYSNVTPEQREKVKVQEEKFYRDTAEIRRELYQKRLALRGLWVDPKADPEKIRAKQREVVGLERRLQDMAFEHRMALRDLVPEEEVYQGSRGFGHGKPYGPHHGKGYGWGPGPGAGGGYTQGHCW
jgi:hypothetical protein